MVKNKIQHAKTNEVRSLFFYFENKQIHTNNVKNASYRNTYKTFIT